MAAARQDASRDARLLSLVVLGTRGDARDIDKTLDQLQRRGADLK